MCVALKATATAAAASASAERRWNVFLNYSALQKSRALHRGSVRNKDRVRVFIASRVEPLCRSFTAPVYITSSHLKKKKEEIDIRKYV